MKFCGYTETEQPVFVCEACGMLAVELDFVGVTDVVDCPNGCDDEG